MTLHASAGDDLFHAPGEQTAVGQLRGLGAWTDATEFLFSARVSVEVHAAFDSGVLLAWVDSERWFKICVECDPHGRVRVVSVVTRGRSDDANGVVLVDGGGSLRIARSGDVFALHVSTSPQCWDLVRIFDLGPVRSVFLGLAPQSPVGTGTAATFDDISFELRALADPRGDL